MGGGASRVAASPAVTRDSGAEAATTTKAVNATNQRNQPMQPMPTVGVAGDFVRACQHSVLQQQKNFNKLQAESRKVEEDWRVLAAEMAAEQKRAARESGMTWRCNRHSASRHCIFINYRVAANKVFAEKLAVELEELALEDATEPGPKHGAVFFDRLCLNAAEDWREGFTFGLQGSTLIVLLMSKAALEHIKIADREQDNVLLEYQLALDLKDAGAAGILPLFLGEEVTGTDDRHKGEALIAPFRVPRATDFPDAPHVVDDGSAGHAGRSVRSTMERIFRIQGIRVDNAHPEPGSHDLRSVARLVRDELGRVRAHAAARAADMRRRETELTSARVALQAATIAAEALLGAARVALQAAKAAKASRRGPTPAAVVGPPGAPPPPAAVASRRSLPSRPFAVFMTGDGRSSHRASAPPHRTASKATFAGGTTGAPVQASDADLYSRAMEMLRQEADEAESRATERRKWLDAVAAARAVAASSVPPAAPAAGMESGVRESIQAVLSGNWATALTLEPHLKRKVTLYVGSTIVDFAAERDYISEFLYPGVVSFCAARDLACVPVDWRWSFDNRNNDLDPDRVLAELSRNVSRSISVAFVGLVGQRFGWRPLPRKVTRSELEMLLEVGPSSPEDQPARDLIKDWYALDSNAVPPCFLLKTTDRGSWEKPADLSLLYGMKGAEATLGAFFRVAIEAAVAAGRVVEGSREHARWTASITEKEINEGVFFNDARDHKAFVVLRTIEGLTPDGPGCEGFLAGTSPDAQQRVDALRSRLEDVFADRASSLVVPPPLVWDPQSPGITLKTHGEYLRKTFADLLVRIERRIETDVASSDAIRRALSRFEGEIVAQAAASHRERMGFRGELDGKMTDAVLRGATAARGKMLVVHGGNGGGKSSLMCALAQACMASQPEGVCIVRLCGISEPSSTVAELLGSVCMHLDMLCGDDVGEPHGESLAELAAGDVRVLSELLRSLLRKATAERPISIFIDGLDNLVASDDSEAATNPWAWLPSIPPPHATLILSCRESETNGIYDALRDGGDLHDADFFLVGPKQLGQAEAEAFLSNQLRAVGRTVSPPQWAVLQTTCAGIISKQGQDKVLALKILSYLARGWDSSVVPPALPCTLAELFFLRLDELERKHEKRLVSKVLSLLTASRAGLSSDNLREMVSGSDEVLGWKGLRGSVFYLSNPTSRVLPSYLLQMLRSDLGGFLGEVFAHGVILLSWHHQELADLANMRYLQPLIDADAAANGQGDEMPDSALAFLADYFSGALAARFPERGISGGWAAFRDGHAKFWVVRASADIEVARQAVQELPFYLVRSGPAKWVEAVEVLCDIRFVEAASALGTVSDLLSQLRELQSLFAASAMAVDPEMRSTLDDFIVWIANHLWAMKRWPLIKMAFSCTSTASPGSAPARQARAVLDAGGPAWKTASKAPSLKQMVAARRESESLARTISKNRIVAAMALTQLSIHEEPAGAPNEASATSTAENA